MKKIVFSFFIFFLPPCLLMAQILPKEGSVLRYRLIGFSFPEEQKAAGYTLEIANGDHTTEASFTEHIICSKETKSGKIIAGVPLFGAKYTWRTVCRANGAVIRKSELHHFSLIAPDTIYGRSRLRIIDTAKKYSDAYVFLDDTRTLYNMAGEPVWYLPGPDELGYRKIPARDIKITPQGTVTFVVEGNEAYEINYNGDILWKGPNDGAVSRGRKEHYHHELTRLKNGNYMVLGSAPFLWQPQAHKPDSTLFRNTTDTAKMRMNRRNNLLTLFGTIIEYDVKGNVVWSWKAAEYFKGSDLYYYTDSNGRRINDVHLNSFYFDEKLQIIYASFKNISRVIKIKYPEGTVLNAFGATFKQGVPEQRNGLFCYQHGCKSTMDGHLYLFNNNSCNPDCPPEIIVFREPASENGKLTKLWEYECPVGPLNRIVLQLPNAKGDGTTGGNVIELPDRSFFVSVCAPYGQVFIVNRDKKIVWSAAPERWNNAELRFTAYPQYRASIITGIEEMEKLIWSTQPGEN